MSLSLCRKRSSRESPKTSETTVVDAEQPSCSQAAKRRRSENNANYSSTTVSLPATVANIVRPSSSRQTFLQSQLSGSANTIRCGKIISMHLTNFMCHSNLRMEFHPRVNFLVGSNGSGKSAVMAALVLGMGAKAKATNRSENLRQLIKTGEKSTKIEIILSNEGSQAYEPDIYGDRITVIRNITQSSASYTIKNVHGNVITHKVDDLHRILMYHNIQVDNPVFVLNQDSAREFLKKLEPLKNYKLFLKATQIETILEKLNECLFSHKDHINRMKCFKKQIIVTKEEIAELKAKLSQLLSLEKLRDIIRRKEVERLWIVVAQHEQNLQESLKEIDEIIEEKNNLMHLMQNKDEVENELTQDIRKLEVEVATKNSTYTNENTLYQTLKNKVSAMNERCLEMTAHIDSYKKRKSFIEAEIQEVNNHIEDHSKNNVGDVAEMRRQNEVTLSELNAEREDNIAIIASAKRELRIFLDNKMQTEEKVRDIKRRQEHFNENIRRLTSHIANIQSMSQDKLSIFGEHVPQLLSEIKNHYRKGKFSQLPRGPIGRYIEVPDEKYRNVVENQLGGLVHGFIVNNTKDRFALENILKQKFPNYHPDITTSKFENHVYDVSIGRVNSPRGTCLLMDAIRCSDPVVMNCLIDRMVIETILIADSKEIAEHLTANRVNVPKNLQKCIVPQPGLEYFPEPHYRMYSMKIRQARIIQVNAEDRLHQLESERKDLQKDIRSLENDLTTAGEKLRNDMKLMNEKRMILDRHESKKRELQEKITELENFEYPEYNEIDMLKKELSECERKHDDVSKKLDDKKIKLGETISEKASYEHELKKQKEAMDIVLREIEGITSKCDNIKTQLRCIGQNNHLNQIKMQEIDTKLSELDNEKSTKVNKLNKVIKEAEKKGERIPSERTEEEILEEIQKLKAKLKHRAQINEDPDKLRKLISSKEVSVDHNQSTYDNIKISLEQLKASLMSRFDFIRKLKQHMVLVLQFSFSYLLKLRNFVGSIEVNHHDKTLDVSVIPRDNRIENAVSNTKSLSGGERSYSTVAFLIALWSCVDHPFYFLDEYDVFTDVVNREYMTRLLISEGKKRQHRQYTFLTPQDMSIEAKDFVKIHKLSEPERH